MIEYDLSENGLFRVGLLRMCERLHMDLTGASDPLPDDVRAVWRGYIQRRVTGWKPSTSWTLGYDLGVKRLVESCIEELTRYRLAEAESEHGQLSR